MKFSIRELQPNLPDFSAVVEIDNAVDPEHRYTVEEFRYDYENFDKQKYVVRYYLAEGDGKPVGYACYHHMPHRFHPQRFWIWVAVVPGCRGRGLGSALYELILAELQGLSAKFLHTSTRETWKETSRFLGKRGFRESRRTWESHLDVTSFDPRPFGEHLLRVGREGITITTLAAEKRKDPGWLEKVYGLHLAVEADVPSSSPRTPISLEEFRRWTLEHPNLLPDGYFLAKSGEEYVGESFVFRLPAAPGHLSQGLTGVRREYRGRGIALALKLRVIEYAKTHGYTLIKTWNDTGNAPMLAINDKLGFQRQPAWIEFIKELP